MALSRTPQPAPYSRIPYAPRPAARRKSKRVGIGDEVLFDGSTGYVDDIDMLEGIEKAYVIGRKGAWAAWVCVDKLHVVASAAVLH